MENFICPCCEMASFKERVSSYEICPHCHWEQDNLQEKFPNYKGGANKTSLNQAKIAFLKKKI